MRDLYIGLMSGTSMDGIDAVLVRFADRSLELLTALKHDYPAELGERLRGATQDPDSCSADDVGELDSWIGECFRDAALAVLDDAGLQSSDIRAIGSHGQTLRHRPDAGHRFTMQIGDPAIIATGTGIDTAADFRRTDMSLGGEGAPLAPGFHDWLFQSDHQDRVVLNIGGIANISSLPQRGVVTGFDTGPGNTLLDAWIREQQDQAFDKNGAWSASGTPDTELLERLLADPWFAKAPPKSTGPEFLNLDWLRRHRIDGIDAADIQATLAELTTSSIARAIRSFAPETAAVFVCGGGAHNEDLVDRLGARLEGVVITSTETLGLGPDWVEAAAFAWLAMRTVNGLPGNLPSVTGASREAVLGALYAA